ncbi:MAG TPA: hypothetical protein VNU25_02180 [Candidatus Paceibacterota bacterium]|nr:hypothetical protein [Candidatus Paceibacterota bacterium]
MPRKDPDQRKEYHARYMKEVWYPRNKEKHLSYVRSNKLRVARFLDEYKREHACVDCGFPGKEFPFVLDFDHADPGLKSFTIGSWSRKVLSIEAIRKEIEKCELVCANCHRKRTFRERVS